MYVENSGIFVENIGHFGDLFGTFEEFIGTFVEFTGTFVESFGIFVEASLWTMHTTVPLSSGATIPGADSIGLNWTQLSGTEGTTARPTTSGIIPGPDSCAGGRDNQQLAQSEDQPIPSPRTPYRSRPVRVPPFCRD